MLGRIPGTRQYRNVLRQTGLVTYPGVLIVRMDSQFYFGNVAFLKDTLAELEARAPEPLRAVVLDASAMNNLDSSAETALREIMEDYQARGILLYLSTVKGPVRDVLDRSGLSERLGPRGNYRAVQDAVDRTLEELAAGEETHATARQPRPLAAVSTATDGPAARPESIEAARSYVI